MERSDAPPAHDTIEREAGEIHSAVLTRLLEEVRNDHVMAPGAYNRQHNRHNR